MKRSVLLRRLRLFAVVSILVITPQISHAVLYVYEPFNYTSGENLGGVDSDPDPNTTAGTPIGQQGSYTADFGSGTTYKWYARGTTSNYQSTRDTLIASGNLSYAGLATSQGNSVSYGSADNTGAANTENAKLYSDSFQLPVFVNSGNLYASFIIRIKSRVYDGTSSTAYRHAMAGFVNDLSNDSLAGQAMQVQSGTAADTGGNFWMRRDPVEPSLNTTNFSPGKLSSDGIGPAATGPSAGWQHSGLGSSVESNQFGVLGGQTSVTDIAGASLSTPQTYFVVLKYAYDVQEPNSGNNNQADTVSLWMNPGSGTLGTVTGEADASQAATGNLGSYFAAINAFGTATHDITDINSFALFGHRQNTGQTVAVDFDELRIGTTWQDVTPAAAAAPPGDYNGDGKVNAADYVAWRLDPASHGGTPGGYNAWRANFGVGGGAWHGTASQGIPEPTAALLALLGAAATTLMRLRRQR